MKQIEESKVNVAQQRQFNHNGADSKNFVEVGMEIRKPTQSGVLFLLAVAIGVSFSTARCAAQDSAKYAFIEDETEAIIGILSLSSIPTANPDDVISFELTEEANSRFFGEDPPDPLYSWEVFVVSGDGAVFSETSSGELIATSFMPGGDPDFTLIDFCSPDCERIVSVFFPVEGPTEFTPLSPSSTITGRLLRVSAVPEPCSTVCTLALVVLFGTCRLRKP